MTTPFDELLRYAQSSDDGQNTPASIQPVGNEAVTPTVTNRPIEHLRARTDVIRRAVEYLNFASDYDRAFVLRSTARFNLGVVSGKYKLTMVTGTEDDLWVYPALTPGRQSGGRYKGGRVFVGDLPYCGTLLTNDIAFTVSSDYTGQRGYADGESFDGGGGNPALTLGANGITLALVADPAVAGGTITAQITGAPKRNITITYGTLTTSTTIDQIIAFVNNPVSVFDGLAYGPSVFFRASRDPATPGGAAPTAFTGGVVKGAYDSEAHQVTVAQFASFFTTDENKLREGECLAIGYAPGPVETGIATPKGGRRQSVWDLPTDRVGTNTQNTTPSISYSLFNTGYEPEKIPGAIPIGKIVNGAFIFIDGSRLEVGGEISLGESSVLWSLLSATTTPTGAERIGYGGSDYYDTWTVDDHEGAGHRQLPAGPVETALDRIVEDYGRINTNNSGARRLGIEAVTGVASAGNEASLLSTIPGSIRQALLAILSTTNLGVNYRVSELGHVMKGTEPLHKFIDVEAPYGGGEMLRGLLGPYGDLANASAVGRVNQVVSAFQPVTFDISGTRYVHEDESVTYLGTEGSTARITMNGADLGTRWADITGSFPVGTGEASSAMIAPYTTARVLHVMVLLKTPATPSYTGYYFLYSFPAAKTLELRTRNGAARDFSLADMTGATLTFLGNLRIGSDPRGLAFRAFHAGNGSLISINARSGLSKLLETFAPDGAGGAVNTISLTNGRMILQEVGTSVFRDTQNILAATDKALLDGVETSSVVNANASHHHGTYTMYQMCTAASPAAVNGAHLDTFAFAVTVTLTATVPANYRRKAAVFLVELLITPSAMVSAGSVIEYWLTFTGGASGTHNIRENFQQTIDNATTARRVMHEITLEVDATLHTDITVTLVSTSNVNEATSTLTMTEIAQHLQSIDH